MSDITVVSQSQPRHIAAGQSGYFEVEGIGQFNSTNTSNTYTPLFKHIDFIVMQPLGGGATNAIRVIPLSIGTIDPVSALTVSGTTIAPVAGTINFVKFVSKTSFSASDTNYYTFGVLNKTATLTPVNIAVAANSTKTTGGSALTAYTARTLTNHTSSAQLAIAALDVLEVNITANNTVPTALTGASVLIGITDATPAVEQVDLDAANVASGVITLDANGQISFIRRGGTLTSGGYFSFRYTGY